MLTHSAVAVSRVLGRGVTLVPEQKPRELPILEIFGIPLVITLSQYS